MGPTGPESRAASAVAVVCHPHPLFGGTLQNKVVHTVARAMQEFGTATVRFNFRGVGGSAGIHDDGRGETDDACAVIAYAQARWPGRELWLGGFSFGAYVALRTQGSTAPRCLITVAPPVGRWDFSGIQPPECDWLVVQGDRDELVDLAAVQAWAATLARPPTLTVMAGADHFFHGRLADLRDTIRGFLANRIV